MSVEAEIQSEVEALKARFTETKSLYREVCALLFFRYGITPTTSKLYQYVRKGSMSAPTDALSNFWEELRGKARIEVDHPDLPLELRDTAAEAIAAIWRQASGLARGELQQLRVEVQEELVLARGELTHAQQVTSDAESTAQALREQLEATQAAAGELHQDMEAERRAHVATAARLQELQRHFEESQAQQQRLRADFSADLAKAREAVDTANARADAADRRALLEIEQERQARAKADKQAEGLRIQLVQADARHQAQAVEHAVAMADLKGRLDGLQEAHRQLSERHQVMSDEAQKLQQQLSAAQQESVQHRTEAATLRGLIERVAPAASEPSGPIRSPSKGAKRTKPAP